MNLSYLCAFILGLGIQLAAPQLAAAQEKWVITDFAARDVDPGTVATFHDLVRDEIQIRNNVTFGRLEVVCADVQCARNAGAGTGASIAVQGSVNRLGAKLVVSVSAAEIASGRVTFSQRMSVDRVEELDLVAKRIAEALVRGESTEDTAELGTITHQEAENPTRRDTRFAGLVSLQGLVPFGGYADRELGAGFAIGFFIETMSFIIEPSVGYRFALSRDRNDFDHVPLDLAFAYLFSRSDVSPFAGFGVGLHYLDEDVYVSRTAGTILQSTSTDVISDSIAGFSVFPRVGLLLLRTYDVSFELTLDYALTFADFQERSMEHGLRLGVGLILGGS